MTHSGQGPEQQYPAAQPLPPEVTPGGSSDAQATQYLPPVPPQPPAAPPGPQQGYGYPQPAAPAPQPGYGYPPPAAPQPGYGYPQPDAQATQYLGAVPPQGPDAQATQYIPPVAPQAGEAATQYLPPVAGPDAQATQYMAPVPPQQSVPPQQAQPERPPLADFDNLFRSETPQRPAPQHQAPPAPQQHYQPPQAPQHPQHPQPQQQYGYQDAYYDDEPEPPRRKSPVALIAAVVAGCAVVGLGAGALLSGGDGDDKKGDSGKGQNVAASSAAPSSQPSEQAADPAKEQAEALDKLLADSNDSRDAVIRAVASIRRCDNLDQAASDLRGAAKQRRELVTRLQSLSVDKVPNHTALSASLVRAWQASAAADDHYAAWADQAKGNKKVCKGGHARNTSHTNDGDKKSQEATAAKKQAAGLWNPTADKYGLPKRTYTQL
ncbi:hypothetical protein [Streptomyces roseicoloratus]|uniref:hypothetical protein n=1 Tax=Streptomyces roseicoloratus TaxID=2508722 RepID=UPI001009DCC0|nr:hypothetical protein [Streptomyces roseicoloratus]